MTDYSDSRPLYFITPSEPQTRRILQGPRLKHFIMAQAASGNIWDVGEVAERAKPLASQ